MLLPRTGRGDGDDDRNARQPEATAISGRVPILAELAANAHFNVCRLLHGSACLPKRIERRTGPRSMSWCDPPSADERREILMIQGLR
jgi:hypothetical protein